MISLVESFPYPDKQGTPEENRRIQRPKRCISTNNNKDVDNSPKNHTQNIVSNSLFFYLASYFIYLYFFYLSIYLFCSGVALGPIE